MQAHQPEKHRVLLVDDDPSFLETTAAILSEQFEVATAQNGADALRRLTEQATAVLCADYQMRGMNGIELLNRAMKLPSPASGLLMTGYKELVESLPSRRGEEEYLIVVKPYDPPELLERVGRAARSFVLREQLKSLTGSGSLVRGTR